MTELERITALLTQITLSDSRRREQKDNIHGSVVVAGDAIEVAVFSRRLVQQYFAEHKTQLDSLSSKRGKGTVSLMLDIGNGSPQPAKIDGVLSKRDRDSVDIRMPMEAFHRLLSIRGQATGSTASLPAETSAYSDRNGDSGSHYFSDGTGGGSWGYSQQHTSPSPAQLQAHYASGWTGSGQDHGREDFWTWSISAQKWQHVDSDSGEVIYCPDELD
jgi:hypothetical protein